ncbi:MAG: AbrB/MazE/SpoVT family DNA-binding domain-containing protein [Candidatus Heimdallarchaeota archaeon]
MSIVKESSKFQIVIPQEIRKKMNLAPGQSLVVIEKNGIIHLIPQESVQLLRGLVKGIAVDHLREEGDRV